MKKLPMKPHKYQNPEQKPEDPDAGTGLSIRDMIGIVLVAGGLWNVPSVLKAPATREDWMMLVVIAAMVIGGAVLLIVRRKK